MIARIFETISWAADQAREIYVPMYFGWLEKEIEKTSPFGILSWAVGIVFVLIVYIWFRNRQ
jgi:hypothetical protein